MTKMPTNHALAPKRSNRDYGQPCMPRLLFRHIVFDLLRVQFLTASVLVAVIAFGAAIRPIMHNLLGPEEVLQFVALASVPMLQYALPFAGAFASTIVYARLAADNEVLAMSAAGMSYARVLRPAIGLGLALFLAMSVLLDAGVPRFWTSMRRMITNDVTRLFVSAVERGEAFAVDGTQLYADEVRVIEGTTDGSGPTTRLQLAGVAAIETGADGRTTTEFTAEFATVDVYRANDSAYLKLLFTKATVFRAGEDALVFVPQAEPEAIDLGKGIRLDPKDHSLTGLLALWNDVDSYHKVADARKEVENTIARSNREARYWSLLGRIEQESKRLDKALVAFEKAIECDPTLAEAYYYRGIVYQRWNESDKAIADYLKASELDPERISNLLAAAELMITARKLEDARTLLLSKLAYFEHNSAMHELLGDIALMSGDAKAAAISYERATMIDPEAPLLSEKLIAALFDAGEYQKCLDSARRQREHAASAQTSGKRFIPARDTLRQEGRSLSMLGRVSEARIVFSDTVREYPEDVDAWRDLAGAALELGDLSRAQSAAAWSLVGRTDGHEVRPCWSRWSVYEPGPRAHRRRGSRGARW